MECLYQTVMTYTYEEYKRFSWKIMLSPQVIAFVIVFELIAGLLWIFGESLFWLFMMIIYPLAICFIQSREARKVFRSNKISFGIPNTFQFYDAYLVAENANSTQKVEYAKLYKIIETKTNFYLMISRNQGFILNKARFPDGLEQFLRAIKIEK